MNRKYPYIKLKEICNVNQGLQIPINERFTEYKSNRYFYITVQFLKSSHDNKYYIENPPISSICNEDDILIVRTGSTGQIVTGVKGCFHNNFFKVNFNKEKVHGRFLYHCLNTKEKHSEMLKRAGVTTIPDLNHFMFLDMEVPLPQKDIQISIANTLDKIIYKIELNNRINAELEQMAKTIYDYWFVQFDFPNADGKPYKSSGGKMVWSDELKREVPEGWEVGNLSKIASITTGKLDSNAEVEGAKYPFFTCASEPSKTDTFAFDSTVILVAGNNAAGNFHINRHKGKFNAYQRTYVFTAKYPLDLEYLYQVLKRETKALKSQGKGSQTKFLTIGMLTGIKVFTNNSMIHNYNKLVSTFYEKQVIIKLENQKLTELRDWLLPMLMNGQVKVGDEVGDEMMGMAAEPLGEYKVGGNGIKSKTKI